MSSEMVRINGLTAQEIANQRQRQIDQLDLVNRLVALDDRLFRVEQKIDALLEDLAQRRQRPFKHEGQP